MGKVRFRCRQMVKIKYLDKNFVPGSTIYVDPGTHLTQDVLSCAKREPAMNQIKHNDGEQK